MNGRRKTMRLIDADALKEEILAWAVVITNPKCLGREDTMFLIDNAPTVDAVPKTELFELFDRITTAWNGKQRFFPQDDGTIYDRNKCDYVKSLDDAVNRFCEELCKDECATVKHGEWIVDMKGYPNIICSLCDVHIPIVAGWCMDAHINYCPNCGAKMDGKGKDDEIGT